MSQVVAFTATQEILRNREAPSAIRRRFRHAAMSRAEQIRRILSTRGLTLYSVSRISTEFHGPPSPYRIPHNLYRHIEEPSGAPDIYQIFSLSRITNYQLSDWLAVFGFALDSVTGLAASLPRNRTVLLDSSLYGTNAQVPWFTARHLGELPPVAPLGQLLALVRPRRARDLQRLGRKKFLYARVGREDANALRHFTPGSILRIDSSDLEESLPRTSGETDARYYLVELASGLTCSQLMLVGENHVILNPSDQHRCLPEEFRLGKEARILGLADAEIRPLMHEVQPFLPQFSWASHLEQALPIAATPRSLSRLLRRSRLQAGLTFREASAMSRRIAEMQQDGRFFAAASTLSDYETISILPRRIQKILTLCAIYCIGFSKLLRAGGIPVERAGQEPIPDELLPFRAEAKNSSRHGPGLKEAPFDSMGFLASLVDRWEEIPLFLRHAMSGLSGIRNFSLSDVFWVGGLERPMHPWLANATFITVNRRIKKPVTLSSRTSRGPHLYLVLKRNGSYLCGCCALEGEYLVVPSQAGARPGTERLRNGIDAEVTGEITAIVRRLPAAGARTAI